MFCYNIALLYGAGLYLLLRVAPIRTKQLVSSLSRIVLFASTIMNLSVIAIYVWLILSSIGTTQVL